MKPFTNEILPQGYKMTELGALPEEWKVVKLGEVADISSGGNAPQGDKYFNGDKPFVRVSHIDNQNYSINKYDLINDNAINDYRLKLFPKGTIVFPKSGATVYLEKRAMLPIDAYVVSHLCTVISNKEKAIQHFLFYVLISLKLAKEKADGYPTLNISEVKQIPIPLPPLPEQKKIAAVLSAVQTAKEKTEAVITATKALKKSMMKHLFTYGPVSPEEVEKVPLKETEIGPVPEDWEVVKLGDTFEFSKKPRNLKIKKDDFVPFIPMEMISETNKSIKSWEEKRNSEISSSSFVFRNDIIIAKITPSFENGKQAILDNLPTDFGYATTEIWALHPAKNVKAITYYLHYYLKINSIRKILAGKMEGSTGRQRLPKHVLENLPIPLPPLPTQQKIASILSAIDAKIEAEENKKKALEELFKSLLHNLMTAKIRVNHLEIIS